MLILGMFNQFVNCIISGLSNVAVPISLIRSDDSSDNNGQQIEILT